MERGVIVGGLMICGSFLLAAMLNRSAMEELPAPAAPVAIEAVVPVTSTSATPAAPGVADCADVSTTDAQPVAAQTEPPSAELMVNGREACPH